MLDANELKQRLGKRAREIIYNGMNMKGNINGKVNCVLHYDKEPSMSWFDRGLNWRCHACGGNIDIYTFLTKYNNMTFGEAVNKVAEWVGETPHAPVSRSIQPTEYNIPNIDMNDLSIEAIAIMKKRGIEEDTLKEWKVKQRIWKRGKESIPVYVFQYFDENNRMTYVTYRKIGINLGKGDKGGCEANTKSILWGIDKINLDEPIVIIEGQIDAMSVWQSGYKNVVSVPSGSKNFKWIDHNWEWLQKAKGGFIVWYDNDKDKEVNVGLEMAKEIQRRLKNVKITTHSVYKDANDLLVAKGEEAVKKVIMDKINETPQGVIDVSRIEYKSYEDVQQGGIETGFIEYDEHVEDWKLGELTVVFGRNGEGKTTYISQVIAHNLYRKNKVYLYSGEMSEQKIQDWLYRQLAGTNDGFYNAVQCKYKVKTELKPEVVHKIKKWHSGNFFLADRSCTEVIDNMDNFFASMETCAKRYGVKLFVIDNLMSKLEENAESLNSDQANFVQKCKFFAINNNVHIVLLAHPNKLKGELGEEDTDGNLEKGDISGSNNIANKADNIIAVERNFDSENVDAIITSLKDRESGQRKTMRYLFSKKTLRFYNDRTCENFDFGWNINDNMKIRDEYITNEDLNDVMPF